MDVDGASRVDSSGCVRNNGANLILWNLMAIVRNNNNGAKGASICRARLHVMLSQKSARPAVVSFILAQ